MTHFKKAFPSDHLAHYDLDGDTHVGTITHVKQETINKEIALVAYFKSPVNGVDKPMRLNVGKSKLLCSMSGSEEIEDWKDLTITMTPGTTNYAGDMVGCINCAKHDTTDESIPF